MRSPNHTTRELLCYEGWLQEDSFNTTKNLWNLSSLLGFKSHSVPVTLTCSRFITLKTPFRAIFRKKTMLTIFGWQQLMRQVNSSGHCDHFYLLTTEIVHACYWWGWSV